jgi:2-methylisocitrate lyase-like PEP mutase family enzyme
VTELKGKGLERCKADDDAGADAFFEQALKILGT